MAAPGSPEPRPAPRIAAVVLAAGRSTRAGDINKLTALIDGVPMVARALARIRASQADPVIVVTGHEAARVRAALSETDVTFTHNPNYAQGMATSIAAGIEALPSGLDGALICLGDMPGIEAAEIDRLIGAFDPIGGAAICIPVAGGRRGNPVLFAARFFKELQTLTGDSGAKSVIAAHGDAVAEVAMAGSGTLIDLDTQEAIAGYGRSE
jgi:molybdenum cofactor cytidylyltransferase